MSILDKIKTRGYWQVVLRPEEFQEKRIAFLSLEGILRAAHVEIRGWDFPHIDPNKDIHRDIDFITQESEWNHHLEVWQFLQSGQFVDFACIPSDWRDQSNWWPADDGWRPGTQLSIGDTLFRFTEIFDFSAALAARIPGNDPVHFEITIHGLKNRVLVNDDPNRWFSPFESKASLESFPQLWTLDRAELVEKRKDLALTAMEELLARFNRPIARHVLADMQAKVGRF